MDLAVYGRIKENNRKRRNCYESRITGGQEGYEAGSIYSSSVPASTATAEATVETTATTTATMITKSPPAKRINISKSLLLKSE